MKNATTAARLASAVVLAFLSVHTPGALATALLFYMGVRVAEGLYPILIFLCKAACFAFLAFLVLNSLSLYLPPELRGEGANHGFNATNHTNHSFPPFRVRCEIERVL